MIRFRAVDGLVSPIADDILAIQDAVQQNIADRLGVIVKKHGVKGTTNDSFDLEVVYVGSDVFEITCSNIGPVVFGDYVYIAGDNRKLSTQATFASGATKYVYLVRDTEYSNDQEDNFKAGHPVDEDGNPPASGYNIESEEVLDMVMCDASVLPVDPVVLIATVTRVGITEEATITDLRAKNALMLNAFGLTRPNVDAVQDMQLSCLYQHSIIRSQGLSSTDVNRTPSLTNMMSNRAFIEASWLPVDGVFGYQTRLQILDAQGRPQLKPIFEIVPNVTGVERVKTFLEAVNGLRCTVSVRTLSGNPNHDPGPWETQEFHTGAPDLSGTNPIPAPELFVISIHGENQGSAEQHLVEICATPSESTPEPHIIQIFKSSSPSTEGSAGISDAAMIYEGDAPAFMYCIPEGEICYFTARTVCSDYCSSFAISEQQYEGPMVSENIEPEFVLSVPIAIYRDTDDTIPFRILSFFPPAPYCRLKTLRFVSNGTMLDTEDSLDTTLAELVVGVGGTFPFLGGETKGQYAETVTKLQWSAGDYHDQMPCVDQAVGHGVLSPEQYVQLDIDKGIPALDRVLWGEEDEVDIMFAMSEWVAETTGIVVAGTLHMVFEKLAVEPE